MRPGSAGCSRRFRWRLGITERTLDPTPTDLPRAGGRPRWPTSGLLRQVPGRTPRPSWLTLHQASCGPRSRSANRRSINRSDESSPSSSPRLVGPKVRVRPVLRDRHDRVVAGCVVTRVVVDGARQVGGDRSRNGYRRESGGRPTSPDAGGCGRGCFPRARFKRRCLRC